MLCEKSSDTGKIKKVPKNVYKQMCPKPEKIEKHEIGKTNIVVGKCPKAPEHKQCEICEKISTSSIRHPSFSCDATVRCGWLGTDTRYCCPLQLKYYPRQPWTNKYTCKGDMKNWFQRDKSIRWRCRPGYKPPPRPKKFSLGCPIGVTYASFNMKFIDPKPGEGSNLLAYAICLAGFAEIFITPENEWNVLVVNRIMDSGKKLIDKAIVDATELHEVNVVRRFIHCKNAMEIKIFEPTVVGRNISKDRTVPGLLEGLRYYFATHKYGLVWSVDYYFLVWKAVDMYFVLDGYGRDAKTFRYDAENGFGTLIALREIENVYHLLINLTPLMPREIYTIRRIQMTKLIPCCENIKAVEEHLRRDEWVIKSCRHAVINAHLNLASECFKEYRYKQCLAVAIIATIYAKIDPPCTWDAYIVDQIILMGTEYYKKWAHGDHCFELGIQDIPGKFEVGQYVVEIYVQPIFQSGQWQCVPNYKYSPLSKSIKHCFENSKNLIIQIERKCYAIFERNNFYYLLDPYLHHSVSHKRSMRPYSIFHMCASIEMLCCIFTQTCLEIPSARTYYIHIFRIYNIQKKVEALTNTDNVVCSCIAKKPYIEDNFEIKSLHQYVEDLRCNKEFDCLMEDGHIEEEEIADLDSPGISATQIPPNYNEFRSVCLEQPDPCEEEEAVEEAAIECEEEDLEAPKPPADDDDECMGEEEEPCVEELDETPSFLYSAKCNPTEYPGVYSKPKNITIIGSETGTYNSFKNLLTNAFNCTDRVLTMTPWGNYVVFKSLDGFFLYDGCTCDIQRFRYSNIQEGTAGLLCFDDLDSLIKRILAGQAKVCDDGTIPPCKKKSSTSCIADMVDAICEQYAC